MKSTENILRSLFISFFPFLALLTTIYAVLQYIENVFLWQTTGMFIVAFAIVTFFAGIFIKPRARTDTYLKPYSVFVLIGAGISLLTAVFLRPISIINQVSSYFTEVIGVPCVWRK